MKSTLRYAFAAALAALMAAMAAMATRLSCMDAEHTIDD